MKNGVRWGLVTFSLSISCGIIGHYVPNVWAEIVFFLALISCLFGAAVSGE